MLKPKILTTLENYSRAAFLSDLTAGLIVGIVALPLAIAFGIASGVSPEKGLITAVVAGFLISALGGSRVQIGGPTGAFVVIIYGIVHKHGIEGLTTATILAGIMLCVMGLIGLGRIIKFIPHPVTVGFTSGIAVIIFSSQVKDMLGLNIETLPADFIEKWAVLLRNIGSYSLPSLAIALLTISIIAFWPRISRKFPGSLIALILCSALVHYLQWPAQTIGSRFGELPHSLPLPHLPDLSFTMIQKMIRPAFAIALLGSIESLLSAVVADGMIGGRHRSNMELLAQGIANIASGLFGGIPATGAIARTATNVKNGGKTPVAGIVHSLTLLLILLVFGKWAKLIPLPCLAGILIVVSYHMSEWRSFVSLLRGPKSDVLVLVATFLLTVFIDLVAAIEIGMVLSAFLFMHRMSEVTKFHLADTETEEEDIEKKEGGHKSRAPRDVEIYEINGPLFFGVSYDFEETMRIISAKPKVRILKLQHVPYIDASGLHALRQFFKRCKDRGIQVILAGLHTQPLAAVKESGLEAEIGESNLTKDVRDAIIKAKSLMAKP